jgi:folate-binding protein YgfZ
MLTDMHVLHSATMTLLDVPAEQADSILASLDQYLFSEDVRIESLGEAMTGVWVHGPRAAAVLEQVIHGVSGLGEWSDYRHATGTFDAPGGSDRVRPTSVEGEPVSVARIDQLGVPGYCVFVARATEPHFIAAAVSAGARIVSLDALHAARIAAGYPLFGLDMTADTIPLEAGIEQRAISFTKGCFVGQEVVIRVLHRGGGRVAKKLVGFRLAPDVGHHGEDVGHPFRGAKVSAGEREIGFVTSAAASPTLGPIALGYVHRDFTAAGTSVQIDGHPATVVGLPMT